MSKKEEKSIPKDSFNLLSESVFGEGGDVVFLEEGQTIPTLEVPEEEVHDETTGEPVDEIKETKEIQEPVKEVKESKEPKQEVKDTEEAEEVSQIAVVASWLGDKGIVDYDPENFEDSEEGLAKLVTSKISQGIESYRKNQPEDVQLFLEYVEAGGDPRKFHEIYYNNQSWENFTIESEEDAKSVLEAYLKDQGEEAEDIKETLDTYEVAGLLEKKAKVALTKIQKAESSYKEQLVEQQKKYDAEQRAKAKEEYESFKKDLYSKEDIKGFKLTPAVKDKLWDYITVADRKTGLTGLQKHNQENTEAQFLYAYLAMNDWDLDKLSKKVATKAASELADKLRNSKSDSRSKIKGGQSDSFADQKQTSGNFSLFKRAVESGKI